MSEKFKASATCGPMKLNENGSPVLEYEIKLTINMEQKQDLTVTPEEAAEKDQSLKDEMFLVIDDALNEAWSKT